MTWLFNGVAITNDPKHSVYGNGDLTLMNIEKNQEGSYKCQARNFLGVEETSAFVVVLGKDFGEKWRNNPALMFTIIHNGKCGVSWQSR